MAENAFQTEAGIREDDGALIKEDDGRLIREDDGNIWLWLKKLMEKLKEKIMGVSLSSIAQWCIILVLLYLSLVS